MARSISLALTQCKWWSGDHQHKYVLRLKMIPTKAVDYNEGDQIIVIDIQNKDTDNINLLIPRYQ